MAVDLVSYRDDRFGINMERNSAQEAASAGLQSVDKLIRILSHQTHQQQYQDFSPEGEFECNEIAGVAVNKFKKFISLLDRTRTGHARFRRGPLSPPQFPKPKTEETESLAAGNQKVVDYYRQVAQAAVHIPTAENKLLPPLPQTHRHVLKKGSGERKESTAAAINFAVENSVISSLTVGADNLRPPISSGFPITNLSQVSSAGRPPLPKRKWSVTNQSLHLKCGGPIAKCHCSKKRKSMVKSVVRVPAVNMKLAEIPPDDFSWRKYGQKNIKGTPYPRGYYKCSSGRGCPARKHVERATDDPTMLIVTYEGVHNHLCTITEATTTHVLES